jgi:hypothetical protein
LTKEQEYQEHREAIDNHLNLYFEEKDIAVFHELFSPFIHLDIYEISPPDKNYKILLTAGMSSRKMNIGEETGLQFAELMMIIPDFIDFGKVFPGKSRYSWIITAMKQAARLPHENETWLGIGHTIQHDADMEPYEKNTEFCGAIILPPSEVDEEFSRIITENGVINFYILFPLYKEELQLKMKIGYKKFLQILNESNTGVIFDPERKNICL